MLKLDKRNHKAEEALKKDVNQRITARRSKYAYSIKPDKRKSFSNVRRPASAVGFQEESAKKAPLAAEEERRPMSGNTLQTRKELFQKYGYNIENSESYQRLFLSSMPLENSVFHEMLCKTQQTAASRSTNTVFRSRPPSAPLGVHQTQIASSTHNAGYGALFESPDKVVAHAATEEESQETPVAAAKLASATAAEEGERGGTGSSSKSGPAVAPFRLPKDAKESEKRRKQNPLDIHPPFGSYFNESNKARADKLLTLCDMNTRMERRKPKPPPDYSRSVADKSTVCRDSNISLVVSPRKMGAGRSSVTPSCTDERQKLAKDDYLVNFDPLSVTERTISHLTGRAPYSARVRSNSGRPQTAGRHLPRPATAFSQVSAISKVSKATKVTRVSKTSRQSRASKGGRESMDTKGGVVTVGGGGRMTRSSTMQSIIPASDHRNAFSIGTAVQPKINIDASIVQLVEGLTTTTKNAGAKRSILTFIKDFQRSSSAAQLTK